MSGDVKKACEPFLPLVAALADGELSAAEAPDLEAHLGACADCRVRRDEQERVARLVRRHAPLPDLGSDELERFRRALYRSLVRAQVRARIMSLMERPGPLLAAAATIALAFSLAQVLVVVPPRAALAFSRQRLPELPYHDPKILANRTRTPASPDGRSPARLTQDQRATLVREGIVQVPAADARPTNFFGTLADDDSARPLVTVDGALFLWNAAVGRASIEVERERIEPELRESLDAVGLALERIDSEIDRPELRRAIDLARGIVGVAADLDGLEPRVAGDVREAVLADAGGLWLGRGRVLSRVLGRELDADAFRPRGPLASAPEHFRAVSWLGRASLSLDASRPDEARAAALIALGLASAQRPGGGRALALWDEVDATVELLHGPQDDLGAFELLSVLEGTLGPTASASDLAEPRVLADMDRRARAVAASRAWELGPVPAAARFTLLGGTRVLESVVLSKLVAPELPGRVWPSSLDLFATLGSRPARTIGSLEGTPGWDRAVDAVGRSLEPIRIPPRAVALAGSGIERSRLFALAGLLDEDATIVEAGEGVESHILLAGLAALNGTPPARLDSLEGLVPAPGPAPLLEPAPVLYARLAHGARRLVAGLERGVRPGSNVARANALLEGTSSLLDGLASASVETLEGHELSEPSRSALALFYPLCERIAPERATSIEDVHVVVLPSGAREFLERASGPFDRLWALARIPGKYNADGSPRTVLALGPALSARELVVRDQRIDADSFEREPRPRDPIWATHIVGR
jgi:hypothetical protein